MTPAELIGRDAEGTIIDSLVDRLPERGGSLLLRGEPGIGKSVLLERARGRAVAHGTQQFVTVGSSLRGAVRFAWTACSVEFGHSSLVAGLLEATYLRALLS